MTFSPRIPGLNPAPGCIPPLAAPLRSCSMALRRHISPYTQTFSQITLLGEELASGSVTALELTHAVPEPSKGVIQRQVIVEIRRWWGFSLRGVLSLVFSATRKGGVCCGTQMKMLAFWQLPFQIHQSPENSWLLRLSQ